MLVSQMNRSASKAQVMTVRDEKQQTRRTVISQLPRQFSARHFRERASYLRTLWRRFK